MAIIDGHVNTTNTRREGQHLGQRADRERMLSLFAQHFLYDPVHALHAVSEQDLGYILSVARAFDWSAIHAIDPTHLIAERSSTYVYPPIPSLATPLWTALRNKAHRLGFFIRPKYDIQQQHTVINVLITDPTEATRHQDVLTTYVNALKATLAKDEVLWVIGHAVAQYAAEQSNSWTTYANVALARQNTGGTVQDGTLPPLLLI